MNRFETTDKMLAPRLDMILPLEWMSDKFTAGVWKRDMHRMIIGRVVEINPVWVEKVVNATFETGIRLTDILHDFEGIYSEDEHFLPRIS
tara:strand:- start:156 stop:425 length:270 start_codon:yes stop_codon:yes gene_type:complete